MARKKETEPISIKFLLMLTAMIILMLVYATTPNQEKQVKENKKTYEEMLEYNTGEEVSIIKVTNDIQEVPYEDNIQSQYNKEEQVSQPQTIPQFQNQTQEIKNKKLTYNEILDFARGLPSKSVPSVQMVLEKLLEHKGYPPQFLKLVVTGNQNKNNIFVAGFDFTTGVINLSRESVYSLNIEHIIPIIAHEIDHFDKLAQMCKTMGIEDFKRFMYTNGIGVVNEDFWSVASFYAKNKDFDLEKYKAAIERYQDSSKINKISIYSTLYSIGENFRNPLEASAYAVSDYIYDYYGIQQQEGSIESLIKTFNTVDWAIYEKISENPILGNERIAVFDYYFIRTVNEGQPKNQEIFNYCIQRNEGNLTEYWNNLPFFKRGEIDTNEAKILNKVLKNVYTKSQSSLTDSELAKALYYRAKTLLANITTEEDINSIKSAAEAYIKLVNQKKIFQPKEELDMILALLCIESNLYAGPDNKLSLYYVKLPTLLDNIYKPVNKATKFNFIYNNTAFQNIKNSRQENISNPDLLVELLNKNRLKHVNQY